MVPTERISRSDVTDPRSGRTGRRGGARSRAGTPRRPRTPNPQRGLSGIPERIRPEHRWLVDFAATTSDSGLESVVRLRLHRIGIELRAQVAIPGVGRVDFLLGDRIILEIDGRENHDGPSKRHKDLVRDANAGAQGYVVLGFDYALVLYDWPLVEAAILRALADHGHGRA